MTFVLIVKGKMLVILKIIYSKVKYTKKYFAII